MPKTHSDEQDRAWLAVGVPACRRRTVVPRIRLLAVGAMLTMAGCWHLTCDAPCARLDPVEGVAEEVSRSEQARLRFLTFAALALTGVGFAANKAGRQRGTQESTDGLVSTRRLGEGTTLGSSWAQLVATPLEIVRTVATNATTLVDRGDHVVVVRVVLHASGEIFADDETDFVWDFVLYDSEENFHDCEVDVRVAEGRNLGGLDARRLLKAEAGVVVFHVPETATPARLELTLHDGTDPFEATWSLVDGPTVP